MCISWSTSLDQLWDNAVKMIKYMSKRGGKFDSHISTFELKVSEHHTTVINSVYYFAGHAFT